MGANVGDPGRALLAALAGLSRRLGPLAVGPLVRSAPLAVLPEAPRGQPPYLNTVVVATTGLSAEEVLAWGAALEAAAGRQPGPRHGPRPLDVDLLAWGDRISDDPRCTLPHPGLRGRSFVLAPLAALAPDLPLPPDGATPRRLLAALAPDPSLARLPWASLLG